MEPEVRLRQLLEAQRPELEEVLADARKELERLRVREAELDAVIRRTESLLGFEPREEAGRRQTLHEAMAFVLRDHPDGLTGRQLVEAINRGGLYTQRSGAPVPLNQVHARAANYPHWFEKAGGRIRLKHRSSS